MFTSTGNDISAYENIGIVGEGTYGKVYKARKKSKDLIVAVKKIEMEEEEAVSLPTIREIKHLTKLKNENIVNLLEVILDGNYFYLIMEYIPFDLSGLIKRSFHLSDNSMLSFAYQSLSSVRYLHSNGIIHRDIKSSNVLLTKDGKIKLVDFGLSREKCKYMTNRVCTLWYRAPELLLGSQNYDEKVDSWSIGCILLELRLRKIPFKGNDEVSQIRNIFTQLGSPKTQYIWSEMLEQSDFLKKEPFSEIVKKLYSEYFDEKLLTILTKLLNPDPIERMTPAEVLSLDIFGSSNLYNSPIESEILNELNFNQKPKL